MRRITRIILTAVLVMLAYTPLAASQQLGNVQTEVGQMAMALAKVQAGVADQHAGLAVKSKGNSNDMKMHSKHVFCILTVDGCPIGTGYPGRKAAVAVAQYITAAAERAKAAVAVIDEATGVAKSAMNAQDDATTERLVNQLASLTAKLVATVKEAESAVGSAVK